VLSCQIDRSIGSLLSNGNADNCDNVLAKTHASSPNEHQTTTTKSVNELDTDNRHARVHNASDDTGA
jgi:hypothetical protein